MPSSSPRRRHRLVLTLAASLVAGGLSVLPVTPAAATPVAPAAVLLPAPTITPTTIPAGTTATVSGTKCVPRKSTRVFVSLDSADGGYVTSTSVVPAADGTWTVRLTPSISTTPGSYSVSATCDQYTGEAPYRSRTVTITATTASPWTGQAPALPNVPNGSLFDVDCVDAPTLVRTPGLAGCVAVGNVTVAGTDAPLVEVWDGSSWTVADVPVPSVSRGLFLFAVECTATTRCVAVGDMTTDTGHEAFVAQLSGSVWSTQVLPPPPGENEASLDDVSCPTSTTCLAIGSTGSLSEGSRYRAIAYRLHGSTWTQVADPIPSSPRSGLSALSCADVKTCVAVGSDTYDYPSRPSAQVFDGKVWHSMTLPTIAPDAAPTLFDVTCATTSSCVAVGSTVGANGVGQPLVETLTNTTWRITKVTVDPAVGGSLSSVSCLGTRQCTAVGATGQYQAASPNRPVAATLANGTWTSAVADVPAGAAASEFHGVSCGGSFTCVAVGDTANVPLAATSTAHGWADLGAVAPDGFIGGEFDAVSCSAANACTAGGSVYGPGQNTQRRPLVNRWNGTTWSLQSLPEVGDASIAGVACPSARFCVAVGTISSTTSNGEPLLLQWNGRVWKQSKVTLPRAAVLQAVSCSSETSCLAVGQSGQFTDVPFGVALNGAAWKVTPKPPVGDLQYVNLSGVSCVTGAGCRVVGGGFDPDTIDTRGVDLVWNGTAYATGPEVDEAKSVSCTSASACVAVGGFTEHGSVASVFDGSSWTTEPLPDPTGYSFLPGISCRGSLSCVTVGSADGAFVARRTGPGTWTAEPTTPFTPGYLTLDAVACPSDTVCVAVGQNNNGPGIVVSPTG